MNKDIKFHSPIMLGVLINPKATFPHTSDVKSYTKDYTSYIIADSSDVKIIAAGINPDNYKDYKYHVVLNDSMEIMPWSSVSVSNLEKRYGAEKPFANLGTYNSPGNQILVEVINKNDYSIRDGIIFDWRVDFTPEVTQIVVSTDRNYFNLNFNELNRGYVTRFDSISGMPLDLSFPLDSINNFRFYFKNHETVPYRMFLKKETNSDTSSSEIDYWILGDYYDFASKHFQEPGKYELTIQAINANSLTERDQSLHFKFEVLPPPAKAKSYSLFQLFYFGGGIILLFGILFLVYFINNKRKRNKIKQQKQMIDLKLKSIQAQLNPHFMFNALSSIQNLMNKNEVDEANLFLGRFSKLTRQVLDAGDEEMISLEDELAILQEYLYMEQLRFNFDFQIKTDDMINKANTEVPAMLLHPFIENAVKHGVSALGKEGKIDLVITESNSNLVMQVIDNGKGFSEELISTRSMGIRLVKERINLLNQLNDQQFELKIESGSVGTKIVLTLKNWF
ncbi:sensor histidine kinase [Draconibacterium sediminis]|uniref:sensor histidine kinase n=1 Tax=Draconibacterium sediminis TaxID=1544798 RepID=UPI0018DD9705|nr:histidine kinase [Draconibacterium sediminis]